MYLSVLVVACCMEFIGSTYSTCVQLHFPSRSHLLAWGVGVVGGYLIYGIFLNLSLGVIFPSRVCILGIAVGFLSGFQTP